MIMRDFWALLMVGGLLLAPGGVTAATYSYTGGNFSVAFDPYTTAMRVTGEFTVATPLTPHLPWTDISAQVTSYRFEDGIQTLTEANSAPLAFFVSTDGNGVPSTWGISVWATPITTMIGGQVAGIDASFDGMFTQDAGFTDFVCDGLGPGGECNSANGFESSHYGTLILEMPPTQGSWTCGFGTIFFDGFESGDLASWSSSVPRATTR